MMQSPDAHRMASRPLRNQRQRVEKRRTGLRIGFVEDVNNTGDLQRVGVARREDHHSLGCIARRHGYRPLPVPATAHAGPYA